MPVRGQRSIYPTAPTASKGLFGKRENKSTADFPNQATMNYAHGTSSRNRPHKGGGAAAGAAAAKAAKGHKGYDKAMNKKART